MEEIFLYVLENEKVNVKMNGDLTQYYGKIKEKYGLNQSNDIDNRINSLFSGLERIVRRLFNPMYSFTRRRRTADRHMGTAASGLSETVPQDEQIIFV
jgi:hypothetical protein